jgi:hypothetical protein
MAAADTDSLSMVEVHDRLHVDDAFVKVWSSFDKVATGDVIGRRADGTPVTAGFDGYVLFPDVNAKPNAEWFYLAKPNPGGF